MKRRLFETLVESGAGKTQNRRGFLWPASLVIHAVLILAVVVLPLLSSGELPEPTGVVKAFFALPAVAAVPVPPPPPPPPPRGRVSQDRAQPAGTPIPATTQLTAPAVATTYVEPDPGGSDGSEEGDLGGEIGGTQGGARDGVIGGLRTTATPAPDTVRVGGDIRPPVKISGAPPVYPVLARAARVQGSVGLECTIDPRGGVRDVRVVRSVPLLDAAAVDAVKQWIYRPTLLNGVPVSVIMTVTVDFKLN